MACPKASSRWCAFLCFLFKNRYKFCCAQVVDREILAIKQAFALLKPPYDPKLTVVTVQKRHNTRFFQERLTQMNPEELKRMKNTVRPFWLSRSNAQVLSLFRLCTGEEHPGRHGGRHGPGQHQAVRLFPVQPQWTAGLA